MAGTWCLYNFLFKPPAGPSYDANFGLGLDRVDAQLQLLSQVQAFYKLKVYNNASVPTTRIDITADMVTVLDSSNNPLVLTNFSKTINTGTTGANGLDTGTLSASNWYYFYCIAKSDGTQAGLASLSSTAPTMPTGYTYKRLVSAIYVHGATAFYNVYQIDKLVEYTGNALVIYVSASATYVSADMSAIVPDIATSINIYVATSDGTYDIAHIIAWDDSGTNRTDIYYKNTGVDYGGYYAYAPGFEYTLNPAAPQTLYYIGKDGNNRGFGACKSYKLDI